MRSVNDETLITACLINLLTNKGKIEITPSMIANIKPGTQVIVHKNMPFLSYTIEIQEGE